MDEEWAVVIVEALPMDTAETEAQGRTVLMDETQNMVGICEVGDAVSPITICDDEAEAFRVSEVVAKQLGMPLYDGGDAFATQLDAREFVGVDADGPDPYAAFRNAAQAR